MHCAGPFLCLPVFSAQWVCLAGCFYAQEYWLDYGFAPDKRITGMKMPVKYVVEMFIVRIAACKVYMGDDYHDSAPFEYYERGKSITILHNETRELLESMLKMLAEKGETETFAYVKKEILHKR